NARPDIFGSPSAETAGVSRSTDREAEFARARFAAPHQAPRTCCRGDPCGRSLHGAPSMGRPKGSPLHRDASVSWRVSLVVAELAPALGQHVLFVTLHHW